MKIKVFGVKAKEIRKQLGKLVKDEGQTLDGTVNVRVICRSVEGRAVAELFFEERAKAIF